MTDTVVRTFRSNFAEAVKFLKKLAIYGSVFLLLATILGQWRADRFPSYWGLGMALIFAPAACAVIGLLYYCAVLVFPVKLLTDGVRCYNRYGIYTSIKWSEVTSVEFMSTYGLHYLVIHASTTKLPITLPTWLDDMAEFRRLVREQIGADHMVTQALDSTAT